MVLTEKATLFDYARMCNKIDCDKCKLNESNNGRYIHPNANAFSVNEYTLAKCIQMIEVIPETVGRCTGLKDKNGKLIFEGDIVKDKESGLFGKVIFATAADGFNGMAGFMVDDVDDGLQNYNGFWHLVEVIGNIHDNPELLE